MMKSFVNKKLGCNYFNNRLNTSVIRQAKLSNIFANTDLLQIFCHHDILLKLNIFGFLDCLTQYGNNMVKKKKIPNPKDFPISETLWWVLCFLLFLAWMMKESK